MDEQKVTSTGPSASPSGASVPSQPFAPQAQTQPPLAPTQPAKKPWLIPVIIAIVVAAAGIAWGVYAYVASSSPEALLRSAIENAANKTAFAAKYSLRNGTEANGITFSGDIAARQDPSNKENGELVLGFGVGDERVGLTVRLFERALYFKLTQAQALVDLLSSFTPGGVDDEQEAQSEAMLKRLNDQWFVVSEEELKSAAEQYTDSSEGTPTPEEIDQIMGILKKHSFIKPDKILADEVIEGTPTSHITLKIDTNELVAFLKEVQAANIKSFPVTDEDIEDAKKESENLDGFVLEAWIARDTREFKQLRMEGTEKDGEFAATLTFMTNLPEFDKIEKPADTKPVSEFMTILLGPSAAYLDSEL